MAEKGPGNPLGERRHQKNSRRGGPQPWGGLGSGRVLSSLPDIKLGSVEVEEGRADHWDYKVAVVPGTQQACVPPFCCLF